MTKEMLDLAWGYRARWRFIGIELGVDDGTLDAIGENNPNNVGKCLVSLITSWLNNCDSGLARKAMRMALKSERVLRNGEVVVEGMLCYDYRS